MEQTKIGIDAGGTLIKVAYQENGTINYRSFRSQNSERVVSWIDDYFENPVVCITGGKSKLLAEKLKAPAEMVVEFDATTNGIQFLAKQHKHTLGDVFLFVNVGTGTSIHYVDKGGQERIGGSGIGGGTLLGLAYLTTGMDDFAKIVQDASSGTRENVDLKVKDIFEGTLPPISGNLTASNFGKTEVMMESSNEKADILASIVGLIGEVIVTISVQMAEQSNTDTIVFIGSSFCSNPLLQNIIEENTRMTGKTPVFLQDGEYSGAVGAFLSLD